MEKKKHHIVGYIEENGYKNAVALRELYTYAIQHKIKFKDIQGLFRFTFCPICGIKVDADDFLYKQEIWDEIEKKLSQSDGDDDNEGCQ